jgi:hypothetical protein
MDELVIEEHIRSFWQRRISRYSEQRGEVSAITADKIQMNYIGG